MNGIAMHRFDARSSMRCSSYHRCRQAHACMLLWRRPISAMSEKGGVHFMFSAVKLGHFDRVVLNTQGFGYQLDPEAMGVPEAELEEVTELLGSIPLLQQQLPASTVQKVAPGMEPVQPSAQAPSLEKGKNEGQAAIEEILRLESIETDYFRAVTSRRQGHFGQLFGGQLIGQALAAAIKSVDPALFVHSLHSYFLRKGDTSLPILYKVERTRDGLSYATRQVSAIQKGTVIFNMQASFKRPEEGVEYQIPMPEVPDPEQFLSIEALKASYKTDLRLPNHLRRDFGEDLLGPIDLRLIDPMDFIHPKPQTSRNSMWLRSRSYLANDRALHACVLAYASDMQLLDTVLRPHGLRIAADALILSLDHSMWFHKPFRADEWLLMVAEPIVTAGSRGFAEGHIYNRNGEVVASIAQEGVIRMMNRKAKL